MSRAEPEAARVQCSHLGESMSSQSVAARRSGGERGIAQQAGGEGLSSRPSVGRQILVAVILLAVVALIAFLGSLATMANVDDWYASARKAPWSPPNAVFGPVWSALYALIALAGWLIWRNGYRAGKTNAAKRALALYVVQLVLNSLWTPVFFGSYPTIGQPAWWLALAIIVALMASVVWLAIASLPWSKIAAWIMLPYLLWLLFATTLNAAVIALN